MLTAASSPPTVLPGDALTRLSSGEYKSVDLTVADRAMDASPASPAVTAPPPSPIHSSSSSASVPSSPFAFSSPLSLHTALASGPSPSAAHIPQLLPYYDDEKLCPASSATSFTPSASACSSAARTSPSSRHSSHPSAPLTLPPHIHDHADGQAWTDDADKGGRAFDHSGSKAHSHHLDKHSASSSSSSASANPATSSPLDSPRRLFQLNLKEQERQAKQAEREHQLSVEQKKQQAEDEKYAADQHKLLQLLTSMYRCRECMPTWKDREEQRLGIETNEYSSRRLNEHCCIGSALQSSFPPSLPLDLLPLMQAYLLTQPSRSFLTHPAPPSAGVIQCLTGDHMVLSRSGWRSIRALVPGDVVASFNVATSAMEWKPVTHTQRYKAAPTGRHELFRMQAEGMDVVATRDHRMLTGLLDDRRHWQAQSFAYETVDELLGQTDVGPSPKQAETYKTQFEYNQDRVVVRSAFNKQPSFRFCIDKMESVCEWWWRQDEQRAFLRFVGFWLGNGSLQVDLGLVVISQRKLESTARLIDLLDEVFPRCWHRSVSAEDDDAGVTFNYYIRCPPLYEWLRVMAVGPQGYNPLDNEHLRQYPHIVRDTELENAEAKSAYRPRTAGSTWREDAILTAFTTTGAVRRPCHFCTEASGVRLTCSGEYCESVDSITCAHPVCVGRKGAMAFAEPWYCPECSGELHCMQDDAEEEESTESSPASLTRSVRKEPVSSSSTSPSQQRRASASSSVDEQHGSQVMKEDDAIPSSPRRSHNRQPRHRRILPPHHLSSTVSSHSLSDVSAPALGESLAAAVADLTDATAVAESKEAEDVAEDAEEEDARFAVAGARAQSVAQTVWNNGVWDIDADGHWFGRKRWMGPDVAGTFANVSQGQAVALLEGFCQADGTYGKTEFKRSGEPAGCWQLTNSSFPLIDHLQLVAQLAGARVDLRCHSTAGTETIGPKGRVITTRVDHWSMSCNFDLVRKAPVSISRLAKPVPATDIDARGYYQYEDDGFVYDITVKDNSNFLTQRLSMKRQFARGAAEAGLGVRAHPVFVGNCYILKKNNRFELYMEMRDHTDWQNIRKRMVERGHLHDTQQSILPPAAAATSSSDKPQQPAAEKERERSELLERLFRERQAMRQAWKGGKGSASPVNSGKGSSQSLGLEDRMKESNMKSMLLSHAEQLLSKNEDIFLLAATRKRAWRGNSYTITMEDDSSRGGAGESSGGREYIGKLKSNFGGTEFVMYDYGVKASKKGGAKKADKTETGNGSVTPLSPLTSPLVGSVVPPLGGGGSGAAVGGGQRYQRESGVIQYDHFFEHTGSPIRIKIMLPNRSFYPLEQSQVDRSILRQYKAENRDSQQTVGGAASKEQQPQQSVAAAQPTLADEDDAEFTPPPNAATQSTTSASAASASASTVSSPPPSPSHSAARPAKAAEPDEYDYQTVGQHIEVFENLRPVWHDGMNAYVLHFDNHRVREKSVKNFKLVRVNDAEKRTVLQFGRVMDRNVFVMDYAWPLSAAQAFAICLSSIDPKIAV